MVELFYKFILPIVTCSVFHVAAKMTAFSGMLSNSFHAFQYSFSCLLEDEAFLLSEPLVKILFKYSRDYFGLTSLNLTKLF